VTQVYIVMCKIGAGAYPVAVCPNYMMADQLRAALDTGEVRRDLTQMLQQMTESEKAAVRAFGGITFSVADAPFTTGEEAVGVMRAFIGRRAIRLDGKL